MDNPLRGPAAAVAATVFCIGGALLLLIGLAGTMLNRAAYLSEQQLLETALTAKVNRTLMDQKALALRDDMAQAVSRQPLDDAWMDEKLGAVLNEGYGHAGTYVLNPANQIIYGYADGQRDNGETLRSIRHKIEPIIGQVRSGGASGYTVRDHPFAASQQRYVRLHGALRARWGANLLATPDGPAVVSVMTIVPTIDVSLMQARPPLLVSVAPLDDRWFQTTGKGLQLPGLRLSADAGGDAVPILADDGSTAAYAIWERHRPGDLLLKVVLPICAILVMIAVISARKLVRMLDAVQGRLNHQEAHSRYLAQHDGLSQLPNRRRFTQVLREALEDAARDRVNNVCVACLDLDRFKDVNDAIGHRAGDLLIGEIGPRLLEVLRPDDVLARLGGDEFAILRRLRRHEDAATLGRMIQSAFQEPFTVDGSHFQVSASVGITVAAAGESDPDRVVQDADISLYQAKDNGRNQFVIFHAAMALDVKLRHDLENDLRAALGTDQIIIHYQPIVSARTGKVTSVEALVRWQHPIRGLIPPDRFISLAERTGLMIPLGEHIIDLVLREANRFGDVQVAINLSPLQLRHRGLPGHMKQLCHRYSVDPARITLEMTENIMLDSSGVSGEVYHALLSMGFRTALDDFGTGYSSLGYLHRFRFNQIKIDRSFISSGSLARMRPIIEAVVHIGRGLNMEIVAEGVETEAEFVTVQSLGCTEAQGYGISRPGPIDQILAFIAEPPALAKPPAAHVYLAHG